MTILNYLALHVAHTVFLNYISADIALKVLLSRRRKKQEDGTTN